MRVSAVTQTWGVDAMLGQALSRHRAGDLAESSRLYRLVLVQEPSQPDGLHLLGMVADQWGHTEQAVGLVGKAIRVHDSEASYHNNLGNPLRRQGRPDLATDSYRRSTGLKPDFPEANLNLGIVLIEQGRYADAAPFLLRAIRLAAANPDGHYNLSKVLKEQGQWDMSLVQLKVAVVLKPDFVEALNNLGSGLKDSERLDAAATCFDRAIRIDPTNATFHLNRGILLLSRGHFDVGWAEHEWRWGLASMAAYRRMFSAPPWNGEPLAGKTILLYAEQGLGDLIQFCRYVPLVAAQGGRILLEVPPAMARLLSGLAGVDQIVIKGQLLPPIDFHRALMTLPRVFATRLETIPADVPYLEAEADRVAAWKARIGTSGFRVGIAWQGSPKYYDDARRSVPLSIFGALAKIPGVRLISVQRIDGLEQLANLPAGVTVENLGPDFDAGPDAFLDTAAVMINLDLVIAIDSAVIHLAGALGRPAWLPLAKTPHWVWMRERDDTPWYPTVRLFRQSVSGDWSAPFAGMTERLRDLVGRAGRDQSTGLAEKFAVALAYHRAGRLDDAEPLYRQIIVADPRHADSLHLDGLIGHQRKNHDRAIRLIERAIVIKTMEFAYYSNIGLALEASDRFDESLICYDRALVIKPDYAEAHNNRGLVTHGMGRVTQAMIHFRRALRLDPAYAQAYINLGAALHATGDQEGATTCYRLTIALEPGNAAAHNNLSNIRREQERLDQALDGFRIALAIDPDFAEAHENVAQVHLLREEFDQGWSHYEWRWDLRAMKGYRRSSTVPQWSGEDLHGKVILLHAEQGIGDAIQFGRYARLVADRGGRVLFEVKPMLMRLMSGLSGVERFVARGDPLPPLDYHCPLMSLPRAFATRTETIPAHVPYLAAEADRVRVWRDRIGTEGFRVGIVWQGNPNYLSDRVRSVPLACFGALAKVPGVRLISLQKVHGLDQLDHLPPGMTVETLGSDFDNGEDAFIDTAAAIMNLDLVVAIDSAVIHLAGALGRPAWLPLARVPHWVWMKDRDDSPWYPTIRLCRQKEAGDWEDVFKRMAIRLNALVNHEGTPSMSSINH